MSESMEQSTTEAPREITLEVSPELFLTLNHLMNNTGQTLDDVLMKAIGLYKTVIDLKREGKHVGVADQAEKLEGEFVGLGSPGGLL